MKFVDLKENLKKGIRPCYKLKGDDSFLIEKSINLIKKACINCFEEFNFEMIDEENVSIVDFERILSTLPIADNRRVILIKSLTKDIAKKIEESLKLEDLLVTFIVVNPEIEISGEVVDCGKMDNEFIKKYILNLVAKANLKIDANALEYIVEIANGEMSYVNAELPKIISYFLYDGTITINKLPDLLTKNEQFFVYNLTSAFDEKDKVKMQNILNSLLNLETIQNVFMFIGSYFRRMFYVSINNDDNLISSALNIKSYAIVKSRNYVRKNGRNYYINAYRNYIELDNNIKNGKITASNALSELLFM